MFTILQMFFATRAVLKIGEYYKKIHYLTRELRVKLHAKTDLARIAKGVYPFGRDAADKQIFKQTLSLLLVTCCVLRLYYRGSYIP